MTFPSSLQRLTHLFTYSLIGGFFNLGLMFHRNRGVDSTTDIKITHNFHYSRPTRRYQIIQNDIGQFFVKPSFIPV
jgi:hypothetical protein